MDSLVHGVEHFVNEEKPSDLKYTILHTFHAVELFLKARLAKVNPRLIITKNDHTIYYGTLIERLKKEGVSLSEQDQRDLDTLREMRNSIEHHQINESRSNIEHYLGRAMYFLESFLQRELGINLKQQLDEETYRILSDALQLYKLRLEKAKEELQLGARIDEIPYLYELRRCEECGEETIIIPDPTSHDNKVHCFFCEARFFVETCERCGSYILSLTPSYAKEDIDEPDICEDCWDEFTSKVESDY